MSSVSALTASLESTSTKYNCATKLVTEFQFGVPFKPEVESLLNSAFQQKELCAQFSAFFWQQLEQFSNIGQWGSRDDSFRRHQASNVLLISHFRATRGELTKEDKASEMMNSIEHVLKMDIFEEELFLTSNARLLTSLVPDETCARKVHSLVHVKKPLSPPLVAYLNGLKDNACNSFEGNLKLALTKMTNLTGTSDWVVQEEAMKEITVQAVLRLLYICAKGNRDQKEQDKNANTDDVAFGPCDPVFGSELLLGDIFSTAGSKYSVAVNSTSLGTDTEGVKVSSIVWNFIFWSTVLVTVLIALYLGLRFLEVIPGMD